MAKSRAKKALAAIRSNTPCPITRDEMWQNDDFEVRAALMLARALNDTGPKLAAVPWKLQEEAMEFYNANGLEATLDRVMALVGHLD